MVVRTRGPLFVVAVLLAAVTLGSADSAAMRREPVYTATGFGPAQRAVIEWGFARFAEAGLRLPPIHLVHHGTTESCSGASGAHVFEDDRSTVHICTTEPRKTLVLHELAHAWDRATLDDAVRSAFLELRALDSWRDGRWHERGAEHAAEILMWGLMDVPLRLVTIDGTSCAVFRAAFVMLTDRAPLRDAADVC